jgi:peroxiredoxin
MMKHASSQKLVDLKPLQHPATLFLSAVVVAASFSSPIVFAQQTGAPAAPQTYSGSAPGAGSGTQGQARRTIQPDLSHPILKIGSPAPEFSLMGVDDKTHTLSDYSDAKVLAIVFESDHCPVSENYETRIRAIYDDYKSKGVQLVAINPNNPGAVRLNELGYTDLTDSFADMKLRVANRHMDWPFLYDGETQALATKFGASATPHIFIFDKDRKLRYEGRIDDNQTRSLVKSNDARNAIDALLAGQEVPVAHTPAFGCTTKWLSKAGDVQAEWEKIKAEPVKVDVATLDDLKKLRANGTSKITVVHFWTTACKDCGTTFHDIETTYRMYRLRDFNFIAVSMDDPARKDAVLKTLQDEYASNTNYQVDTRNVKSVQEAIGAKWKPGTSYTMVVLPDGKVVYQKEGKFDIHEMRRAVLANMPDGRAYAGQHEYWSEAAGTQ